MTTLVANCRAQTPHRDLLWHEGTVMLRVLLPGLSLVCLLALTGDIRANGLPPPGLRLGTTEAKLVVQYDPNAKQPVLIIPNRLFNGRPGAKRADAGNLNTAVAG